MPKRNGKTKPVMPAGRPKAPGRMVSDAMFDALAEAIEKGSMSVGDLMPPERELALRHKVGRITVRRALRKLAHVGVLECCPRVGYRVVRQQRDHARGRPVGVIRQDVTGSKAPSKSVGVIENLLAASGRGLLIGSSGLNAASEDACIRRFRAAGVAGLIVTPATAGGRSGELEAWIRAGMPVVLEGHPGRWLLPDDLASRCDQVDIDNCGAIRRAMEYLCGLGHTRLAYLSSSPRAQSERVAAFEEFARECGFAAGNAWVLTDLADSREGGGEGLRRLLEARPEERPTAVICTGSDRIALGLVAAARGRGLRCPEDLSVINFGDNRLSDDPRNLAELTSLEFSQEDMANTLMSLLQEQMAGARRSARQVRTPMELIVRQSCAPANAASRPAAG